MFSEHRYWHGNEPCHQVAFMFNYAGEPWKTQQAIRHIMETEYLNAPGGLSGNDDAGQMSAWYIFASLGFIQFVQVHLSMYWPVLHSLKLYYIWKMENHLFFKQRMPLKKISTYKK